MTLYLVRGRIWKRKETLSSVHHSVLFRFERVESWFEFFLKLLNLRAHFTFCITDRFLYQILKILAFYLKYRLEKKLIDFVLRHITILQKNFYLWEFFSLLSSQS